MTECSKDTQGQGTYSSRSSLSGCGLAMAVCLYLWPCILWTGPLPTATAPQLFPFEPGGVNGFLPIRVPDTLLSLVGSLCSHRPFIKLFLDVWTPTWTQLMTHNHLRYMLRCKKSKSYQWYFPYYQNKSWMYLFSICSQGYQRWFFSTPRGSIPNTPVSTCAHTCTFLIESWFWGSAHLFCSPKPH